MKLTKKPVLLAIIDGFGIGKPDETNAIFLAKTPTFDYLYKNFEHMKIHASAHEVGLPENQMGNSEVGHMNIGCGRVLSQSLSLIFQAIEDKSFFQNKSLINAFTAAKKTHANIHLIGLLSDGGVHSHILHFFALMKMAQAYQIKKVYIHAFLDGRDTYYCAAIGFIKELLTEITKYDNIELASLSGRYYAMDRDKRFERTQKAYDVLVEQKGESFTDPIDYLNNCYAQKVYDEFIIPAYNQNCEGKINDNDSVIGVNFRPDRMIQISSCLTNNKYLFIPKVQRKNLTFVQMMCYDESVIGTVAFRNPTVKNSLGEVICRHNMNQLRIAETEKFAHVTYFLNGGIRQPFKNEDRILIPSPKVATYDLKPEMSAYEVTKNLIAAIKSDKYDFIALNFANTDMVGHSGKMQPTIKAVETVDECLGKIIKVIDVYDGTIFLTADHGNADLMIDANGDPITTHSLNLVSLTLYNSHNFKFKNRRKVGKLADIAPSILTFMHLDIPKEMDGEILIYETSSK